VSATAPRGRPRLPGARHPSGQLVRAARDASYSPSTVKRLVDSAARGVQDRVWGTPLGRLHLEGKLTATEFAAGLRWDRTYAAYRTAIGAPSPFPRPAAAIGEARAIAPDMDGPNGEKLARKARKAIREFEGAHKALCMAGLQAEAAARALCEGEGKIPMSHLAYLKARDGLQALARHWQL
jgi:hypothetical protein